MLVALPSAIAFGVTIYAVIGGHYGAYGAIAGILGVAAIGIVAALIGGTNRLISAPSAPAAAVLSAFALTYISNDYGPDTVFVMIMVVAFFAGLFQIVFGVVGLGKLIKYMPFPVVSGYLSGVGLYIIVSQAPKFLGLPQGTHILDIIMLPVTWQWQSITVGLVTMVTMAYSNTLIRSIPSVIVALFAGAATYFMISLLDPALLIVNNSFVIGEFGGSGGIDFGQIFVKKFEILKNFAWSDAANLMFPALTLAALLSIDTLKTCVILDSMTHSSHNSNKELIAQGAGNITSSLLGGMSGSGTMGATMVNLTGGAVSSLSGVIEGVMAIIAFVLLGTFLAWIPIASLAGILIVIGLRMIDRHSLKLLKNRKTALDFFIIISVTLTALTVSLIVAAAVGFILAIILFIVQQVGSSVVYRQLDGSEVKSKTFRPDGELIYLSSKSDEYSLYELHGSLFFGTADQLYTILQDDLQHKKYIILDMKRVQTVDLTAAHILLQIKDILHDNDGYLVLSRLPHKLPTGDDMESYFNHVGLLRHLSPIKVFDDLDDSIEWVENHILKDALLDITEEYPLSLGEFSLFRGRKTDTLAEIETLLVTLSFSTGETIYVEGESTGEIFLIRSGAVRIMLPYDERKQIHLSTLTQGNFFGEFSFLDGTAHYTDTVATSDTQLYMISRDAYNNFSKLHKNAALHFMEGLASVLAQRLKVTRSELALEYDV